jgi:hypothetical protein
MFSCREAPAFDAETVLSQDSTRSMRRSPAGALSQDSTGQQQGGHAPVATDRDWTK